MGQSASKSDTRQDQSSHVTTTTTTNIGDIGLTGKDFIAGIELLESGFEKVVDVAETISINNLALTENVIGSLERTAISNNENGQPVIISEGGANFEQFTPLIIAAVVIVVSMTAFKKKF